MTVRFHFQVEVVHTHIAQDASRASELASLDFNYYYLWVYKFITNISPAIFMIKYHVHTEKLGKCKKKKTHHQPPHKII